MTWDLEPWRKVFVYGSEGADGEARPDDLGTGAEAAWSEWSNSYANAAPWAMQWGNQNSMFSGASEQNEEAAKDQGWGLGRRCVALLGFSWFLWKV